MPPTLFACTKLWKRSVERMKLSTQNRPVRWRRVVSRYSSLAQLTVLFKSAADTPQKAPTGFIQDFPLEYLLSLHMLQPHLLPDLNLALIFQCRWGCLYNVHPIRIGSYIRELHILFGYNRQMHINGEVKRRMHIIPVWTSNLCMYVRVLSIVSRWKGGASFIGPNIYVLQSLVCHGSW